MVIKDEINKEKKDNPQQFINSNTEKEAQSFIQSIEKRKPETNKLVTNRKNKQEDKDASEWANILKTGVDNVFTNLKTKYSFQGEIGAIIEYDYHKPSGRYFPRGDVAQDYNLLDALKVDNVKKEFTKLEENENEIPKINPDDAFGEPYESESDVPF